MLPIAVHAYAGYKIQLTSWPWTLTFRIRASSTKLEACMASCRMSRHFFSRYHEALWAPPLTYWFQKLVLRSRMYAGCAGKTVRSLENACLYLSTLGVWSQGGIQIHVHLTLPYLELLRVTQAIFMLLLGFLDLFVSDGQTDGQTNLQCITLPPGGKAS